MRKSKRRIAEEAAFSTLCAGLEVYHASVIAALNVPKEASRQVRIAFNKLWGYYVEIPSHMAPLPDWRILQTGRNGNRYLTPELEKINYDSSN